jgi:hypothetical protein
MAAPYKRKGPEKSIRQYGGDHKKGSPLPSALSAEQVEELHRNSDVDTRAESQHHTTGPGPTQASPGDHRHRGGDSLPLLDDMIISGDISDGTVITSIIACLVALGATDSSTP